MAGPEIIFAIIDDRAIEHVAEEKGGSPAAAVGDDQVGAELRLGLDRVVDRSALLEVLTVDLGPGDSVAGFMLGRHRHLMQLEGPEHLGRRSRAAR